MSGVGTGEGGGSIAFAEDLGHAQCERLLPELVLGLRSRLRGVGDDYRFL